MRGHTHALIGITTVIATNAVTGFIQPHQVNNIPTGIVACLGVAIIGALAPDIDAEDSSIKRGLGVAGEITSFGLRLFGVRHRGLTHYGLVALLVTFATWLLTSKIGYGDIGLAFGVGYLSHIALGDAMTQHGVPLLWPLPGQFHLLPRPFRIRTGGPVESLIFIATIFVFVLLLPQAIPPEYIKYVSKIF